MSGWRAPGGAAPGGGSPRLLAWARRSPAPAPADGRGGRGGGERHVVEVCYSVLPPPRQAAALYARCVCGWTGPRHPLQPHAPRVAERAADWDAAEHAEQPLP